MSSSKENISLHTGHRQRLKKRFLREPQHAEDYEVLEILLGYALTRKDTKPLAKQLLLRFGTLRNVLDARREELEDVAGFGPGLWTLWQVIRECMARHAIAPLLEKEVLATPQHVAKAAQKRLAGRSHEECWMALLDAGNRCVGWECLGEGKLDNIAITPRDVIAKAFERKAHGFILVHNHPGGNTNPSRADMIITEELRKLAPRMNIRFVEHIIITAKECRSILLNQYF